MATDVKTGGTGLTLHIAVLALIFVLAATVCPAPAQPPRDSSRADTLWIFDADFEDLLGDNAGWVTEERSGTAAVVNYWHKDTLMPCPRPMFAPGTLSWWCGTYDPCWKQPRGYGNDWVCCLERYFPLSEWSEPGNDVRLEFDQRYAMERSYDYGYVDVSTDGGGTWTTLAMYTNAGFSGPGLPVGWDDPAGRQTLDLSASAGTDILLRFRFESDIAYSSEDEYDNANDSVKDGAWQIDNVEWIVGDATIWLDDCESPGENGWEHTDVPATGQIGITFFRGQLGVDFLTNRPPQPGEPPPGTWMYAAADLVTSRMVDSEDARLISPPVPTAGAPVLVGEFHCWVDFPEGSNDDWGLHLGAGDRAECIDFHQFNPNPVPTGPEWVTIVDDWGVFAGNDWLKVAWDVYGGTPDPRAEHMGGLFLNRVRVGVLLYADVPDDEVAAHGIGRVYPNPFNPAATIEYTLASCTHTTVRIVDGAGRVVRTLLDAPAGPGVARITWDGTTDGGDRAASGVYFVVMEADGATSARKAVLLK